MVSTHSYNWKIIRESYMVLVISKTLIKFCYLSGRRKVENVSNSKSMGFVHCFFFLLTWNIRLAEIQPTNSWGRPPSPDSPLLARRVRYPSRLATMGNLTPKNFPSLLRHPTTLARFVSKEIGEFMDRKILLTRYGLLIWRRWLRMMRKAWFISNHYKKTWE